MKKILLSQNKIALIDDGDFEEVNKHDWMYDGRYARTRIKGKELRLHRLIMNPAKGLEVDHINGDSLDNRRMNLRLCSHKENLRNQRLNKANTSGFKGVCWVKNRAQWQASIRVDQRCRYLGSFSKIEEAAKAYNDAATKYFGEFARINHI